jgi:uncharacterized membrane protein
MAQANQTSRIEDAAETIHELRRERHEDLSRDERAVETFMHKFGRPRTIAFVAALVIAWIALNLVFRGTPNEFDPSPYGLLNLISQLCSLVLVIAVLSAQNTQSEIDQERARLMLQLAIVQDRKISEVLKMLGSRDEEREPTDLREAREALRDAEHNEKEKEREAED